MVHSSGARVAGVRTAWRVIDDGDFYCAGCGGDRCYQRMTGRRRFTLLGVPLLPRGAVEPVVECASCRAHHPVSVLDRPTTTRLAGLLRDAVHSVALLMLSAGGDEPAARRSAVETVRAAGFPECTEERLLTLQAALACHRSPLMSHEVHATLGALAPHLEGPGRETLVFQGARIALADGPYRAAERAALVTIGDALGLSEAETDHLLAEAAAAASN
ncbi:TerB family tellurite resistance protein [Streptomyces avicenniae]|uniref:TerB family tellurite resistance protein n=1 Tax=Streptomyces avicenniae TaxID=500153 RepID=UPI00069A2F0F|nr:TerB family tellurite resistance protein [Streptomyces avicenniae]